MDSSDDGSRGPGIRSGAAPRSAPAARTATPRRFAERFRGVPGHPYEQGFDLRLVPEKLAEPLRWPSPKMVFVNSMSDLFHRDVPDDYIEAVCRVMAARELAHLPGADQALRADARPARRPARLRGARAAHLVGRERRGPPHGLPRVEHLRAAPAGLRMLSVEPLLEDLGPLELDGIGWVIVGGESGPGARPMEPAWVASIRDQCRGRGRPLLLQAVGRRAQRTSRPHARRPDARRGPRATTRGRPPALRGAARPSMSSKACFAPFEPLATFLTPVA